MYSIKKVSEMLNIPTVTIRAWESRYHIISPTRTVGGHRVYSDTDIEILQWLQKQMKEKQLKISEAVSLLKQTYGQASNAIPPISSSVQQYDELVNKLYHQLIDLDRHEANETIDLAFTLYNFQDVFHNILSPVLHRIGEQWEAGSVTVAQEHFATELFLQRYHQFLRVLPTHSQFPRALAFCPEGEHHQMGLMLFTLFLRSKGMDVIYLGPNTPYTGLTEFISKKNIHLIVVSLSDPKPLQGLQEWIKGCHHQFPALKFVLGGDGFLYTPKSLLPYVLDGDYKAWEDWFRSTFHDQINLRSITMSMK